MDKRKPAGVVYALSPLTFLGKMTPMDNKPIRADDFYKTGESSSTPKYKLGDTVWIVRTEEKGVVIRILDAAYDEEDMGHKFLVRHGDHVKHQFYASELAPFDENRRLPKVSP